MKRTLGIKMLVGALVASAGVAGGVTAYLHKGVPVAQTVLSFACSPGIEDVYSVVYSSSGVLADTSFGLSPTDAKDSHPLKVDAAVTGTLRSVCVSSAKDAYTVALSFASIAGSLDLPSGGAGGGPAAQLLVGTTFVTRDARGHTREVRFPAEMGEGGRSLVRDVLSLGQITLAPPGAPAVEWQSREEDANGTYEAKYTVERVDGHAVHVAKKRVQTEPTLRADALRPRIEVKEGTGTRFVVDDLHGRITSVDARSSVAMNVGRNKLGSTDARLALTLESSAEVGVDRVAALQGTLSAEVSSGPEASDLSPREADARLEADMQRKELGQETWRSLSARLGDKTTDRTRLFLQLKALFITTPASCAEAGRTLARMSDPNDPAFSELAGALASAGNPESQRALLEAAKANEGSVSTQRALVASLGMATTPSGATADGLTQLASDSKSDEVRDTARLALGTVAKGLTEGDPGRAEAVVKREIDGLRSAGSAEEKVLALLVLGNSGSPATLEAAREALRDTDERVRAAAASALRFVDLPEAERILVALLGADPAASVRVQAVSSLAFRNVSTVAMAAVVSASEHDSDEGVRMAAVQIMGGDVYGDPELVAILERIAANDRATGVRNAARLAVLRYQARG